MVPVGGLTGARVHVQLAPASVLPAACLGRSHYLNLKSLTLKRSHLFYCKCASFTVMAVS